jgi:hypothetical protein
MRRCEDVRIRDDTDRRSCEEDDVAAGARSEAAAPTCGSATTRIDRAVGTMARAGARAEGGPATARIDEAVRKMAWPLSTRA